MKAEEHKIIPVKPNDLISGKRYLKLIADFKEYEHKLKSIIEEQQAEIKELRLSIDFLTGDLYTLSAMYHDKDKQKRIRANYAFMQRKIVKLKQEIYELNYKLGNRNKYK